MDKVIDGLPALSGRILIQHCGTVILDRKAGFADRAAARPITDETIFDFGSTTKQFVAAAILQLRDDGALSLSDPIGKYISGLSEQSVGITIHQLLTHSAGLPLYSGKDYDPVSKQDFISWLRTAKLVSPPGTRYSYSNPGYSVLAYLVEERSGEDLERFLRMRFFDRLRLHATGYREARGSPAVNYRKDGSPTGTPLDHPWRPSGPYWNLFGNGGILSNASDFVRWFDALHEGRVLSARSTKEMFSRHVIQPDEPTVAYGYGWRIIEDERGRWINHGGSNAESFFVDLRYFEASDAVMVISLNGFDADIIRPLVRGFADVAAPVGNNGGASKGTQSVVVKGRAVP